MRSKLEEAVAHDLEIRKVDYTYESEKIPYVIYSNYIPDFIINGDMGKLYIECKGFLRNLDKRKLKAVRDCHQGIDLRLLFHEKSKPRDIKWAIKNNFIYAIGIIPESWLMTKHPANRYERLKINEKKRNKRKSIEEVPARSSRTLSSDVETGGEDN